jgi:hypothetical protein
MAVLVTPNLTPFDEADALGTAPNEWSESQGSAAVVTDIYREATGSIGCELRSAGVQYLWKQNATSVDLTDTHVYVWVKFLFIANLDTEAGGGVRIRVGDGSNWGDWVVAGSDTWGGQWKCFVADANASFDFDSGTPPNIAAITQMGIALEFASSARNLESTFVDVIRYGDGLTVTSGVSDGIGIENIFAYQDADTDGRAHGIISKEAGVYIVQGKLRFGSVGGSLHCDFDDTSKVIVFKDAEVATDLYELIIQGTPGTTTNFVLGNKSGGRGIQGFTIRSEGAEKYNFTVSGEDIDVLKLYGTTFFDAAIVSLPFSGEVANREMLDCTFEACGEVIPQTFTTKYCNFVNADNVAVSLGNLDHNLDNCNFIGCPVGMEVTVSGEIDLTNCVFTGNTVDIWNSSGGPLTVTALGTSDPVTYSGEVTIVNAKSFMLTGLPQNTQVTWVDQASGVQLYEVENVGGDGEAEYQYNYVGDVTADIHILHMSYKYRVMEGVVLSSSDQTIPVTLEDDPVYYNP